jgi:hypothetical protein
MTHQAPAAPPALTSAHLADARVYATRNDMIDSLPIAEGGCIAEIGVATGDFSEILIKRFRPKQFVAFDLFTLHTLTAVWGRSTTALFNGKTHADFYRERFDPFCCVHGDRPHGPDASDV